MGIQDGVCFMSVQGTPAVREEVDDDHEDDYSCVKCAGLRFADERTFLGHHLSHVRQPKVTLSRLAPCFVHKLTSGGKSRPHRPVGVAKKKRAKSCVAPKSRGGRLESTRKLSADAADSSSKNRTFRGVSKTPVLAGPAGEVTSATSGMTIDGVTVETAEREAPTGGVVDGSGEMAVEVGAGEPTEGLNGGGGPPEGEGDHPEQRQRMMGPGMQRPQMQGPRKRASPMGTPPGAPPAKRRDNGIHPMIGVQQKRPGLTDSPIHLTESITPSVRQPPSSAVTVTPVGTPPENEVAEAVANVLASRGITVTLVAAGGGGGGGSAGRPQQRLAPATPLSPVATLSLTSAITIIPMGGGQQAGGGFAVPQSRIRQPQAQNAERSPAVDRTGDGPTGIHRRGGLLHVRGRRERPPGSVSSGRLHVWQIGDGASTAEESLGQRVQPHPSHGTLPYRCNLCPARYPAQQGLLQHRQVYHKEQASGPELAIPVVDLERPGVLARLANLGVVSYVQLVSPQGGHFGLPVVSVGGARDPAAGSLGTMGASNILLLGPVKQLPR